MPGRVPGIHEFLALSQDVDGRDKPGHDDDLGNRALMRAFELVAALGAAGGKDHV